MTHQFSEEEWNDYIEGELDDETRDRFEAHLIGCLGCWKFYERMAHATDALRTNGAGMRAIFALQDRRLSAGLRAVFAKIDEAEAAEREEPRRLIQQRLEALAAVMAPMCGSLTARKALNAAALVSRARSLESVTEDNWTSFLASLKPIAAVMCGETGARLVWESGQF
ncbi:MAG: zf-HC2 domain-containing protein [Chloracidobacterium sp.]|nr:zf-HC2 domain-containing protein [Chloracidobacterium sp.]